MPAEQTNHPWATRKTLQLAAPKFVIPVTDENKAYNARLLKQSILEAIRKLQGSFVSLFGAPIDAVLGSYTGQSPSFATVIADSSKWIVPETRPTWLVEPEAMVPEMLELWAKHWLGSADPESDIATEKRLRFTGQQMQELIPPLHDPAADDVVDDDEEDFEPPAKAKAPKAKKSKPKKDTTHREKDAQAKPKSRQLPRHEVFVEIPVLKKRSRAPPRGAGPRRAPTVDPAVPAPGPSLSHMPPSPFPSQSGAHDLASGSPGRDFSPANSLARGTPTPLSPRASAPPVTRFETDAVPPVATSHTMFAPAPLPQPTTSPGQQLSPDAMDIDTPFPRPAPAQLGPAMRAIVPEEPTALVSYASEAELSPQKANDQANAGGPSVIPAATQPCEVNAAVTAPGESEPHRPQSHPRPRPRAVRQAQVAFKVALQYEFKESSSPETLQAAVDKWAAEGKWRVHNVSQIHAPPSIQHAE